MATTEWMRIAARTFVPATIPHELVFAALDAQYDAMWLARAKKLVA